MALGESLVRRFRNGRKRIWRFATDDDGVTTVEWVAIAGVAIIIGVTMTWLTTSNLSDATSYIGSHVNSAANP